MSFTPNIPVSGQSLGQTRDPIRNNFTNYNNVISQDHVAPNNSGEGKHNKSTYVAQGSPPATLSGEIAFFGQVAASGSTEVFLRRDAVATSYQLTGPASSGNGTLLSGGTTTLLGGIILKWAVINIASAGTTNYTWVAEAGSAFSTTLYAAWVLPITTGTPLASYSLFNPTITGFSINTISPGQTAQIMAIGI